MATLHGTWVVDETGDRLFLWGEVWRRIPRNLATDEVYPLAMTEVELREFCQGRYSSVKWADASWERQNLVLPEIAKTPTSNQEPTCLHSWQVEGFCLKPLGAIAFLQALPLGTFDTNNTDVGGDLQFWAQVYRWSLDLLVRCKFLPGLERLSNDTAIGFATPEAIGASLRDAARTPPRFAIARWQPLLDSEIDQRRLERFSQLMPSACRAVGHGEDNLPMEPQELLLGFLRTIVDTQIKAWADAKVSPTAQTYLQEWLQSLTKSTAISGEAEIRRLTATLETWTTPVQDSLVSTLSQVKVGQKFRTCFVLQPTTTEENWRLEYCLQATDNPDLRIDAETIWSHPVEHLVYENQTLEQPQETFLKGLGLASRIYPPIEASLQESRPQQVQLSPIEVYQFIKGDVWRLQDSGLGVILPPGLAGDREKRLGLSVSAEAPPLKKGDRLGLQSLLQFKWELSVGEHRISKSEFERLLALKSPLVQVNGEWIALQPAEVRAAEAVFKASGDLTLSVEDALRLKTGESKTLGKLPIVQFEASGILQELINNLTNNQAIASISPPQSFVGELRPYQLRGVSWLAFLERWSLGACLADDMGLGKTPQLIAFLLHLQEQDELDQPILVICPTSVLGNWEREVKKFAPKLKVLVHHGDKRDKGKIFAKAVKDKHLVITSYPLIYRDAKTFETVSWQGVVLDEAQNIKNPQAKQSQAVRQLPPGFRIALTGTPVENRLQELWSILDFLNPGYLGTRDFFQRRFAIPIEKYGDRDSLKILRSLVQPFILRRLKTDRTIIQDLPEKQEMTVFCGLSSEQAALYQKLVDESLSDIESADGIQRHGKILTLLMRLKQICNHPAQYLKENKLGQSQRSGKLRRLEEMLEEVIAEGDRTLIFTQFAEWGKLLQPHLQKHLGRDVLFLYGSTKKQQREDMIDRFQNDPNGPPILILSLKAGGTGLNLTRANHVFHFDRWWNPAVENQASDRAFRIGQTRNVQVHKFVCNGTLEEKINDIIESKKQLAEQTVDAGEQWLTELDTNQLRNLLLLDRTAVIDEE